MDCSLLDRPDLLRRDVGGAAEHRAGADGEAVEDVGLGIAEDLVDLADLVSVACGNGPTALDDRPGDGIGHQAGRRPTSKVAPCVPIGFTSLSARVIRTWPVIPTSSSRARHRPTIPAEAP